MKKLKFKQLPKAVKHFNQKETLFYYLQEHIATASMAAEATGISQKNIAGTKEIYKEQTNFGKLVKAFVEKQDLKRAI